MKDERDEIIKMEPDSPAAGRPQPAPTVTSPHGERETPRRRNKHRSVTTELMWRRGSWTPFSKGPDRPKTTVSGFVSLRFNKSGSRRATAATRSVLTQDSAQICGFRPDNRRITDTFIRSGRSGLRVRTPAPRRRSGVRFQQEIFIFPRQKEMS